MADRGFRSRGLDLATDGVAALLDLLPVRRPSLAVLTYHRVDPADRRPDLHPGLNVTPDAFAEQVDLVARHAHPVSLHEVLRAADGGDLPARAVHVTFDDAYLGVERHAWPILRERGMPASLFVPTAHPGSDRTFWWDRLHHALATTSQPSVEAAGRTWPLDGDRFGRSFTGLRAVVSSLPHDDAMRLVDDVVAATGAGEPAPDTSTWAGIRRIAVEGMSVGSHSRTHPVLTRVDHRRLRDEVEGSFDDLRRELAGGAAPAIAYPGGGIDGAVVDEARRAGARLGFTTERGVVDPRRHDWLALPRINVGSRATGPVVHLQLHAGPHRARGMARRFSGSLAARSTSIPGRKRWN